MGTFRDAVFRTPVDESTADASIPHKRTGSLNVLPWVDHHEAAALEVAEIARRQGKTSTQGDRSDLCVELGNGPVGATARGHDGHVLRCRSCEIGRAHV